MAWKLSFLTFAATAFLVSAIHAIPFESATDFVGGEGGCIRLDGLDCISTGEEDCEGFVHTCGEAIYATGYESCANGDGDAACTSPGCRAPAGHEKHASRTPGNCRPTVSTAIPGL